MRNTVKKNGGFTLIELLIVIAIIGILAAVLIPNLLAARNRANESATQTYVRSCVTAIETARNSVTQKLPAASTVTTCEMGADDGTGLGEARLVKPAAVTSSTVAITDATDSYTIEATSVTGKKFAYNGREIVEVTP